MENETLTFPRQEDAEFKSMMETSLLRTGNSCDTFFQSECLQHQGRVMQQVLSSVTEKQKDLLLRGLRFVRSSVKLDMSTPSEAADNQRAEDLQQVEALIGQIEAISNADC